MRRPSWWQLLLCQPGVDLACERQPRVRQPRVHQPAEDLACERQPRVRQPQRVAAPACASPARTWFAYASPARTSAPQAAMMGP